MFSAHNASASHDGSRTIAHNVQTGPEGSNDSSDPPITNGTLRLRGGPRRSPRVAWDEHVIDNEDCGRKKSKICCIYHKPKDFDESSDEESSSDSDPEDDGRARPRHAPHRHHRHHQHESHAPHNDGSDSGNGGGLRHAGDGPCAIHQVEGAHEPNAYEIQPSHSKKGKGHADRKYRSLVSDRSKFPF